VVGGIALSGGKGTIWGAILGVLFIGILKNAFILLGIPLNYQYVVMGVILIFAVGIDSLRRGEK
jgi:ribose transport system permease protein